MTFLVSNLMPSSSGILLNFYAGNLPACFMHLRAILEFMAEAYVADRSYPDEKFFHEKMRLSEAERRKADESISKTTKKVDRYCGTNARIGCTHKAWQGI